MTQLNNHTPTPKLPWFDKINADIANSAGVLSMSQSLAKQANELSASMQLAKNPLLNYETSGAMQMLKQAQESANRISVDSRIYDAQTLKIAEAMRKSMSIGIDTSKWQQLSGLQASVDAVAKFTAPVVDVSALTGIGTITPPKWMLAGFNISALNQATIAAQSFVEQAMLPRGLAKAVEEATKSLTVPEQLLKQMQGLTSSTAMQVGVRMSTVPMPDFEKYVTASQIVGKHYSQTNIDNVLRRFEQLQEELELDIPVENADDIDDLVEDTEAVEAIEDQIFEDGVLKPSISQALFGFNISELTLTPSSNLVVFVGSTLAYLFEVLGTLLDENATAARIFATIIIGFIPVYGSAKAVDEERGKDSPAA